MAEIGAVPQSGPWPTAMTMPWLRLSNGYYKAELIRGPARSQKGPWKTVEDVELTTLGWVH